ncbi:MAG: trigger factor, partial [Clostridia bacterium]|nr:trigger factor [Clostridia bacterium]
MTVNSDTAYVNGTAETLDTAPIIRGSRTMLPVRFVAEKLGATVEWDGATSTATVTKGETVIKITIGAENATVNGESVALDAPAFIENSRTYMPVRFVAEKLGATVEWDGATSTAIITLGYVSLAKNYTMSYPDSFDFVNSDLYENVTVGKYKGLTLKGELPAAITDRAAQNGDKIIVNFVGKVDGVAFDGGTANNYKITLGAGGFIEGFEEGMVGMKVGETKAVETVFPADYGAAALAGKTAIFDITLLSIYEEVPAKLTDDYVKATFGYKTVKEYKAAIKAELTEERNAEIVEAKADLVIGEVFAESKVIMIPEGFIKDHTYMQILSLTNTAAQYGLTYEDFLMYNNVSVEEYEGRLMSSMENSLAQSFVVAAIAKAEGLVPTKEECDEFVADLVTLYELSSLTELSILTGYSEEYFYNVGAYNLMAEKVMTFLAENNKFTK